MSALEELERNAYRFKMLREMCGHVEDGSSQTVKLFQDDATFAWFVKVGNQIFYAESFGDAVDKAIASHGGGL